MLDAAEILTLIVGAGLVAFMLWFFFGAREGVEAGAAAAGGAQELDITVKGGYAPDVVVVKRGAPVRLNFYRDETESCSERVVFRDFGIARDLPAHQKTAVEFTPEQAGEYTFTCGMGMMRGKLIVRP